MSLQHRPAPSKEASPASHVFQWQQVLDLHASSFRSMSGASQNSSPFTVPTASSTPHSLALNFWTLFCVSQQVCAQPPTPLYSLIMAHVVGLAPQEEKQALVLSQPPAPPLSPSFELKSTPSGTSLPCKKKLVISSLEGFPPTRTSAVWAILVINIKHDIIRNFIL